MKKILDITQAVETSKKLRDKNKKIVLAGGCFDLLHEGHDSFLKAAKKQGDILFVLLESDISIKNRKGQERPYNALHTRIQQLLLVPAVDYVIALPDMFSDQDYDELVSSIKPAIIATTKGDPYRSHKERQAAATGAIVRDVIERLPDFSTTTLLKQQNI